MQNSAHICSSCARPWIPSQYKTCDKCRASRRRYAQNKRSQNSPQNSSQGQPRNPSQRLLPNLLPNSSSNFLPNFNPFYNFRLTPSSSNHIQNLTSFATRDIGHHPQSNTPSNLISNPPLNPASNSLSNTNRTSIPPSNQPSHQPSHQPSNLPSNPTSNIPSNIPSIPINRTIKKRKTYEVSATSECVKLAINLLEDEFRLREIASQKFPPDISSTHIRSSISKYEDEMWAASQRS